MGSSSPLTSATATHDFDTVEFLLRASKSGTQKLSHPDKVEAMRTAVKKNDLMIVIRFLDHGMKPTGWDFINAVKNRSYPIIELFLRDGYDINRYVREDWPPPLA